MHISFGGTSEKYHSKNMPQSSLILHFILACFRILMLFCICHAELAAHLLFCLLLTLLLICTSAVFPTH